MKSRNNPLSKRNNIVVQELAGEVLIYDLSENKAFCLNQTSALVWHACDGIRSIPEIVEFISKNLKSPANEDLVWFALDQLKKENLIVNGSEIPFHFAGMSRREVVKKVGLGTMIALPIVASLIAPLGAQAQSQNCTTCVKFQQGDTCSSFCSNLMGTCYENAGCGGGQSTGNVTCLQCATPSPAGVCMGGPNTCSWKQP